MTTPSSTIPCLSGTRTIADTPVGNITVADHRRLALTGTGIQAQPDAWLAPDDIKTFLASPATVMTDDDGAILAWKGSTPDASGPSFAAKSSFPIRYPWDLLRANEQYLSHLAGERIDGSVHPAAVIEGTLHLGTGSRILPGVYIEGNVVIGADCKIGPNCYIRGNTSIGDNCHIGQSVEIKNCLILSKTNVGHLSYVGDSVLGETVNLGAGTITSNFRHDGSNHRSLADGVLVDTGRRKFGAILGDGVHTGIHTSIYPGRKLWPNTSTRPGDIIRLDVQPDS